MVLMKLKALQTELENVEGFRSPVLELEQYMTSSHIAAHMLYNIEMSHEDIEGKSVVDLGCGTGMLTVAASLLGASYCLGLDLDANALEICKENISEGGFSNIDLLQMNVQQQLSLGSSHPWFEKFDTVITNPPFGTKQVKGIDIDFVKFGLLISKRAVYSLHKSSHTNTVMREMRKIGVEVERTTQISFDLPKTYKIHKHNSVDISVEMLRFVKK